MNISHFWKCLSSRFRKRTILPFKNGHWTKNQLWILERSEHWPEPIKYGVASTWTIRTAEYRLNCVVTRYMVWQGALERLRHRVQSCVEKTTILEAPSAERLEPADPEWWVRKTKRDQARVRGTGLLVFDAANEHTWELTKVVKHIFSNWKSWLWSQRIGADGESRTDYNHLPNPKELRDTGELVNPT